MTEHIRVSTKGTERFTTEAAYTRAREQRELAALKLEESQRAAQKLMREVRRTHTLDRLEQNLRAAYIAGEIDVDEFVAAMEEL